MSQKLRNTPRMVCHSQATEGCGKVTIQHDPAERFLTDLVFTALGTPAMRATLGRQEESTEERDLNRRLVNLDVERKRAYDAFVKGWVPQDECDTCFKRRKDRHRDSLLVQRLEVVWRV